jgi:CDP-diacylglycerol pyrophosphatase
MADRLAVCLQWFALCAAALAAAPPAHASRDALRQIVQQQCLPHWQRQHDPAPCLQVHVSDSGSAGTPDGYALLADIKGGAHLLLIPLRRLSGIESPELLESSAPNYFAAAWQARGQLGTAQKLADDQVGLAVNSRYSRGQDQLHIHIECQGLPLHQALSQHAGELSERWTPLEVQGDTYFARRVAGGTLAGADPLRLLSAGLPDARGHLQYYTLIVAGLPAGPGFALLARRAFLRGGEKLLDASCAVVGR